MPLSIPQANLPDRFFLQVHHETLANHDHRAYRDAPGGNITKEAIYQLALVSPHNSLSKTNVEVSVRYRTVPPKVKNLNVTNGYAKRRNQ